jgi:hypothetical protein
MNNTIEGELEEVDSRMTAVEEGSEDVEMDSADELGS